MRTPARRTLPCHGLSTCLTPLLLSTVLGCPLALLPLASSVAAATVQSAEHSYAIAAQPLDAAILQWSATSGVQLFADGELTRGKRSSAVQGRYSAEAALQQLLAGSGLTFSLASGQRAYLQALPEQGAAMQLGAITIDSQMLGATTEDTGSYTTGQVSIAKTGQTLKETPQTVSVMTRQRIEDQHLTSIHDVLNQTSGVSVYQGSLTSSRYLARGFEITSYRIDGGSPLGSAAYARKDHDMAMYDHVEVLRGSDGLFSGNGEPGGSINLVRKRPTAAPRVELENSVGSWNNYRSMLDVSGPLAFDGKLKGRSVLVYNDRDMFYDKADAQRSFFYGVLEADLSDDTTVLAGMTYDHNRTSDQAYGWPRALDGTSLGLPRSHFLAGADDFIKTKGESFFLRVDQRLSDTWTATLDTLYAQADQGRGYYNFYGVIDPADGSGSGANWQGQAQDLSSKSVDFNLKGDSTVLGLETTTLVGWNWTDVVFDNDHWEGEEFRQIDDIFAFDPDDYRKPGSTVPTYKEYQRMKQNGLYGSLRVRLFDPLHVIVGGRYSNYSYTYDTDYVSGRSTTNPYSDRRVFTPFFGATYDLTPQWSLYASVADIYKSQADLRKASGGPLKPITGTSHELGIKGELLDGRVNTYAALYYVKREGQGVREFRNGVDNCCYNDDGLVTSKGLDLEISGELFERFQASLGYTYNHVRNNVAGSATNSLTPKHLLKLFGAYQMPGAWSALKVGGGVTAQSPSYVSGSLYVRSSDGEFEETSDSYAFSQAGYAIWSGFAEYQLDKHWSLALNANNLLDKKYYATVGQAEYGNFYGDPRNYTLTLRGVF
ncbi:TonB-dependent siderophore receptor [Pseudomonas cremoricolorata]|uniref:TonB-dependent siderophore receptor n=1 Tax=Pseudomonas cremoricolorata TaxID=157783 RepID=UPI000675C5F0|nr:TonB-dependent receptor [Pseudomonas cremoricolorata]